MNTDAIQPSDTSSPEIHAELRSICAHGFSRSGHLWLLCYFGSYLDQLRLEVSEVDFVRKSAVNVIRQMLDRAFEGRTISDQLAQFAAIRRATQNPELSPVFAAVSKLAQTLAASPEPPKPIAARWLVAAWDSIEQAATAPKVERWLRNQWRAYRRLAEKNPKLVKINSPDFETTTDSLIPTRYILGWLTDHGTSRSAANASAAEGPSQLVASQLAHTAFSPDELSRILASFLDALGKLPALTPTDAAKIIGCTVDRTHRLSAAKQIESFSLRRHIALTDIDRRLAGMPGRPSPQSPAIADSIQKALTSIPFSLPQLLQIEQALHANLASCALPVAEAGQRLGCSKMHVHQLVRKGALTAFGYNRLVPESEAIRLSRSADVAHVGRPRISEG